MLVQLQRVNKRKSDLAIPVTYGTLDVDVQIRGGISITSPVFTFTANVPGEEKDVWDFNYLYVEKWQRFYFIEDIYFDGNIFTLSCEEDVLASWYDQIEQQSFFCTRSSSRYNENLCDSKFPTQNPQLYKRYRVSEDPPWTDIGDGSFVLAITAGQTAIPHFGTNTYYVLSFSELSDFMDSLLSTTNLGISGLADNIVKSMINPLQYIRSCYYFPFKVPYTDTITNVPFSWWTSTATAHAIDISSFTNCRTRLWYECSAADIEDSGFFENVDSDDPEKVYDIHEYQLYPPYSQYILAVFPFGLIELPTNIIHVIRKNGLYISIDVDHLTGMGELTLWGDNARQLALLVTTCQVAVEIPVGEILQNFVGAAVQIGTGAAAAFSGNIMGAASGIISGLESLIPACSTQGVADGIAQLQINHGITLSRYYQNATLDGDLVGYPLCETVRVSELSGFAKFEEVEMRGTMLDAERGAIEAQLCDGVFVEGVTDPEAADPEA